MGRMSSGLVVVVVVVAAVSSWPTAESFSLPITRNINNSRSSRRPIDHRDCPRRRFRSSSVAPPRQAPSATARHMVAMAGIPSPVVAVAAGTTSLARRIVMHGVTTFASNWKSYSLIPLVAGFVGWCVTQQYGRHFFSSYISCCSGVRRALALIFSAILFTIPLHCIFIYPVPLIQKVHELPRGSNDILPH